jgi:hypothetical protein
MLPQEMSMKTRRLCVLALLTIAFGLPSTMAGAEPRKVLVLPIAGSAGGGITFNGSVTVQGFVQRKGEVFAVGAVSGSLSSPAGPIGTALALPVMFSVQVSNGLTARADGGSIHPASRRSPDRGPRVIFVQSTTCGVLHLDLGAVNLNVLGAVVTTTPVTIDINGDTGGALGNLVCTALSTVNNVVGLVNVLNTILGTVTGLLGGLAGGLGGVVPM